MIEPITAKRVTAVYIFNIGPKHARRVEQRDALTNVNSLLAFGDCRFVTRLGYFFSGENIDDRRFADVRNAHDHRRDRLAIFVWHHVADHLDQSPDGRNVFGRDVASSNAIRFFKMVHPDFGHGWIGKVALGQDFQARQFAPKFGQHWIFAGKRNPRIQNLDDQIDFGQRRLNFKPSLVHVARKPLDGHRVDP